MFKNKFLFDVKFQILVSDLRQKFNANVKGGLRKKFILCITFNDVE